MGDGEKLIGLIIGLVLIIIFISPQTETPNLSGEIVEITVISPTSEDYPKYKYLTGLAENALNEYCTDIRLNTTFHLTLYNANRSVAHHYDIVTMKHNKGVDLVVGGGWSSYLTAIKSYLDDNHVLIISPSATTPMLDQDDYIYRLSVPDINSGKITAHVANSLGVNRMVVIDRGDNWARINADLFNETYYWLGYETIGRVTYTGDIADYTPVLNSAEQIIEETISKQPDSKIGVFLLAYSESLEILSELDAYPLLSNATWFSTDVLPTDIVIPDNFTVASKIALISPKPSVAWNAWSTNIASEYYAATGDTLDFTDANVYDSCVVLGLSVIEADSVNASQVREEIVPVAEEYHGLTGFCGLDENGDRRVYLAGLYRVDENLDWGLFNYYSSENNFTGAFVYDE